jgi:hypothetical protein
VTKLVALSPPRVAARLALRAKSTLNTLLLSSTLVTVLVKPGSNASASMAILAIYLDTLRHVCANVLRRFLGELTTKHDERQAAQRKDWNAFVHP